jgi:NACHT domain
MESWLRRYLNLGVDEASLLLGILIPLLSLVFPAVRRMLVGIGISVVARLQPVRSRYRRWFLHEHGKLKNIYLNRIEKLDLADTYISLSVKSEQVSNSSRQLATRLFSPAGPRRILLVGEPGTGKSTLLKAYASGVLRRRRHGGQRSDLDEIAGAKDFPVFLPLRQIAKSLSDGGNLDEHILEVLRSRARSARPTRLMRRLLRQGRMVVLLDGLDEVAEAAYSAVRAALLDFANRDEDADLPTSMARIVISCRRQNFLQVTDDWLGLFADQYFSIAPLEDAEIQRFIGKRREDFSDGSSPEQFFADVRASGTLELHRIPLVLTISLGLYTQLAGYEIPHSLGEFYSEMIKELLRRHDFRTDRLSSVNRFRAEDKLRFLQVFAIELAEREIPFNDFFRSEIVAHCSKLQPNMAHLKADQVEDFVAEIIDRSGLLTSTSADGHFAYAHRAFHEHLVAGQLARRTDAGARLMAKVHDPEWRQTIIMYCGNETNELSEFLLGLSNHSAELAGHCLAVALVPVETASKVIGKVRASMGRQSDRKSQLQLMSALIQATLSPVEDVKQLALRELHGQLVNALDWDKEQSQRIVSSLLASSPHVASLLLVKIAVDPLPEAIKLMLTLLRMPDDEPRLVAPLWHFMRKYSSALRHPSGHSRTELKIVIDDDLLKGLNHLLEMIVAKLVHLAMTPEGFAALQAQDPITLGWVPESHRRAAYPMRKALPFDSNLVMLLGSAYTLKVLSTMPEPNAYIEAFRAPGAPLQFWDSGTRFDPNRLTLLFRCAAVGALAISCIGLVWTVVTTPEIFLRAGFWVGVLGVHFAVSMIVVRITWVGAIKYVESYYGHSFSRLAYFMPGLGAFTLLTRKPLEIVMRFARDHRNLLTIRSIIAFLWGLIFLPITMLYSVPLLAWAGPIWLAGPIAIVAILLLYWLPGTGITSPYMWLSAKQFGPARAILVALRT